MTPYPKRLIEVDLPIKKISEHSRREKSIRHGHISTLHIWWARRPLAACCAVICAALWPDPADPLCPERFKRDAAGLMKRFFDPMGTDGRDFNETRGGSGAGRAFSQRNYGMDTFEDLFTPRQALALTTLARLVREAGKKLADEHENGMAAAVQTCLAFAVDRMADKNASLAIWNNVGEKIEHVFSRQALPITWDFPEVGIFSDSTGNWLSHIDLVSKGVDFEIYANSSGYVKCTSATSNPLPDNCARSLFTDPHITMLIYQISL